MSGINKVLLIGRLGKDPEMRYTPNGKAVTNFTVATSETWIKDGEKQESTEWHRIVMWGKSAENAAKLLAKGSQVYIEGKLQTRQWEDKDGNKRYTTEINASSWQILGSSGHAESTEPSIDGTPADNGPNPAFDDIPW